MKYQVLFPEGKKKAFTLSYDDAQYFDRRLVEMCNKYKVRGTFHLNAGTLGTKDDDVEFITKEEVKDLYEGHEISCHGLNHPYFPQLPKAQIVSELYKDKAELEKLAGYPVRGMSIPFDEKTSDTLQIASDLGLEYARSVQDTMSFGLPDDFMRWDPTCHHDKVYEVMDEFMNPPSYRELMLFYVWGHSFEFDRNDNWEHMDKFLSEVSGLEDVWYATNIEIKDYIEAFRNLKVSIAEDMIYNPSATPIWIKVGEKVLIAEPGKILKL